MESAEMIQVIVRVRPISQSERDRGEAVCVKGLLDGKEVQISKNATDSHIFPCSKCFPADVNQTVFFQHSGISNLLDSAFEGYRACAFAFGQTGAGKTYTVLGPTTAVNINDDNDGLMGRSLDYIFKKITYQQLKCVVKLSVLEVYHEHVYDLFTKEEDRQHLVVREHSTEGFFAVGAKQMTCTTLREAVRALDIAMRHRQVDQHEMNARSSRSHCVMEIHIETTVKDTGAAEADESSNQHADSPNEEKKLFGRMTLVDLAGSERLKATNSTGKVLHEAGFINRSLYVLGKVIAGLARASGPEAQRDWTVTGERATVKDVPFRESKLTKLLIASLGGQSRTVLVACVSSASGSAVETMRTLNFSMSCAKIKNRPVKFIDPHEKLILDLKDEIKRLRNENKHLKSAIIANPTAALISYRSDEDETVTKQMRASRSVQSGNAIRRSKASNDGTKRSNSQRAMRGSKSLGLLAGDTDDNSVGAQSGDRNVDVDDDEELASPSRRQLSKPPRQKAAGKTQDRRLRIGELLDMKHRVDDYSSHDTSSHHKQSPTKKTVAKSMTDEEKLAMLEARILKGAGNGNGHREAQESDVEGDDDDSVSQLEHRRFSTGHDESTVKKSSPKKRLEMDRLDILQERMAKLDQREAARVEQMKNPDTAYDYFSQHHSEERKPGALSSKKVAAVQPVDLGNLKPKAPSAKGKNKTKPPKKVKKQIPDDQDWNFDSRLVPVAPEKPHIKKPPVARTAHPKKPIETPFNIAAAQKQQSKATAGGGGGGKYDVNLDDWLDNISDDEDDPHRKKKSKSKAVAHQQPQPTAHTNIAILKEKIASTKMKQQSDEGQREDGDMSSRRSRRTSETSPAFNSENCSPSDGTGLFPLLKSNSIKQQQQRPAPMNKEPSFPEIRMNRQRQMLTSSLRNDATAKLLMAETKLLQQKQEMEDNPGDVTDANETSLEVLASEINNLKKELRISSTLEDVANSPSNYYSNKKIVESETGDSLPQAFRGVSSAGGLLRLRVEPLVAATPKATEGALFSPNGNTSKKTNSASAHDVVTPQKLTAQIDSISARFSKPNTDTATSLNYSMKYESDFDTEDETAVSAVKTKYENTTTIVEDDEPTEHSLTERKGAVDSTMSSPVRLSEKHNSSNSVNLQSVSGDRDDDMMAEISPGEEEFIISQEMYKSQKSGTRLGDTGVSAGGQGYDSDGFETFDG